MLRVLKIGVRSTTVEALALNYRGFPSFFVGSSPNSTKNEDAISPRSNFATKPTTLVNRKEVERFRSTMVDSTKNEAPVCSAHCVERRKAQMAGRNAVAAMRMVQGVSKSTQNPTTTCPFQDASGVERHGPMAVSRGLAPAAGDKLIVLYNPQNPHRHTHYHLTRCEIAV